MDLLPPSKTYPATFTHIDVNDPDRFWVTSEYIEDRKRDANKLEAENLAEDVHKTILGRWRRWLYDAKEAYELKKIIQLKALEQSTQPPQRNRCSGYYVETGDGQVHRLQSGTKYTVSAKGGNTLSFIVSSALYHPPVWVCIDRNRAAALLFKFTNNTHLPVEDRFRPADGGPCTNDEWLSVFGKPSEFKEYFLRSTTNSLGNVIPFSSFLDVYRFQNADGKWCEKTMWPSWFCGNGLYGSGSRVNPYICHDWLCLSTGAQGCGLEEHAPNEFDIKELRALGLWPEIENFVVPVAPVVSVGTAVPVAPEPYHLYQQREKRKKS